MDTILLIISLIAALLYLLLSVFQALRQRAGSTSFTTLLALVTLVTALLAVYLPVQLNADTFSLAVVLGAVLLAAGLVLVLLERRRPEHKPSDSRGILAMATGVLLFVGLFGVPYVARMVFPALSATPEAVVAPASPVDGSVALTSSGAASDAEVALEATTVPATASATPVASTTPLPPRPLLPSPTPTHTPVVIATWVPTEDAPVAAENAQSADCVGFVQNNLNLRAEPALDGALLVTIPSSTALTIAGTSADGGWLRTTYGQMSGWVSADYVLLGDRCQLNPAQAD